MFQSITGKPFCPIAAITAPETFRRARLADENPARLSQSKGRFGRGLGNPHQRSWEDSISENTRAQRMFLTKPLGSWKCRITAVSVLGIETSHHAQAPAVLDHASALPQGLMGVPLTKLCGGRRRCYPRDHMRTRPSGNSTGSASWSAAVLFFAASASSPLI